MEADDTLKSSEDRLKDSLGEWEMELWITMADCPEEIRDQEGGSLRLIFGSWSRRIGLLVRERKFKQSVRPGGSRVLPQFH